MEKEKKVEATLLRDSFDLVSGGIQNNDAETDATSRTMLFSQLVYRHKIVDDTQWQQCVSIQSKVKLNCMNFAQNQIEWLIT